MNKGNIDRILHTKQKQYQQWIKAIINFRMIKKTKFFRKLDLQYFNKWLDLIEITNYWRVVKANTM